jgi:hypothetical protein
VWGRGQYGGGGYESFRSVNCIGDLSLAVFAPGWTAEFFDHDLKTREGYTRWREDDDYLWRGNGVETSNVQADRLRLLKVRKQGRGVQRARELAIATTITGSFAPLFDYDAPFAEFPSVTKDNYRPISSYFTSRSPLRRSFYTNFTEGAGHDCWIGGVKVMQTIHGWTDIEFHWLSDVGDGGTIIEDDAYMGSCSVRIEMNGTEERRIHIASSNVVIESSQPIQATIIWKSSSPDTLLEFFHPVAQFSDPETKELSNGWLSTISILTSPEAITISSIVLSVSSFDESSSSAVLIGSVALVPLLQSAPRPVLAELGIRQLSKNAEYNVLQWKVGYEISAPDAITLSQDSWPTFLFFAVYHLAEGAGAKEQFVGTTFATEFDVASERGTWVVKGIKEDGTMDPQEGRILSP